jgi:hypothetical protein
MTTPKMEFRDGGGDWPASSDPYFALIVEAAHAWFSRYTNEFAFDQKADEQGMATMWDPIKLRFGAWAPPEGTEQVIGGRLRHRVTLQNGHPCFYVAAIGFDVLVTDSGPVIKRYEKGFWCLKMDPEPVIELYLQRTPETTEDADMELVLRFSAAKGMEFWSVDEAGARLPLLMMNASGATFHVPTNAGGGPAPIPPPSSGPMSFLAAGPGSLLQVHLQGDQNLVCYDADPVTGALSNPHWDILNLIGRIEKLEAKRR